MDYRRPISKNQEPFHAWFSLGCLFVLAVFILGMVYACPQ